MISIRQNKFENIVEKAVLAAGAVVLVGSAYGIVVGGLSVISEIGADNRAIDAAKAEFTQRLNSDNTPSTSPDGMKTLQRVLPSKFVGPQRIVCFRPAGEQAQCIQVLAHSK